MTDQNTLDKITSWASDKYSSAAPSLAATAPNQPQAVAAAPAGGDGLLSAATSTPGTGSSTPTSVTTATPTSTTSSAPKANVSDWYRSTLGRDGDAAGISFWQQQVDSGADPSKLYDQFKQSAAANNERVNSGSSWTKGYTGPQSNYGATSVDEWGKNVLGRDLTADETSAWSQKLGAATTPEQAQQVYKDFLAANAGGIKNNMDLAGASQISGSAPASTSPTSLDPNQLARRVVDPKTETVNGQMQSIMAADSPLLQQARADGMRTAFDRGLGNSSIAASAGEDSLLRAALEVATPDAATYGKAADYNTAATNQAVMWNADQANQFALADKNIAAQQSQQAQQMTIAQMQDATQRWQVEKQDATSRYNTDAQYKQQVDNQNRALANNIIQNMDLSPDRKAAMLEQLGFGTMAKDGVPGTGLAGAVFVLDSVGSELAGSGGTGPTAASIAWPNGQRPSWSYPTSPDYDEERTRQAIAQAAAGIPF